MDYQPVSLSGDPTHEASSDEQSLKPTKPPQPSKFLRPRVYWPVLIILAQSLVLTFGWAFYGATRNQAIVLPNSVAKAYDDNAESITFVPAQIARMLSLSIDFFFSHAVRYALTMALSKPLSLFSIANGIRVSGGRPILNTISPKWTLTAAIVAVAALTQHASWTTLLTPRPLEFNTGVSGSELDLTNPDFLSEMLGAFTNGTLSPSRFSHILPLLEASGIAAGSGQIGLPAVVNFNHFTFSNSTGGILPVSFQDIRSELTIGEKIPTKLHVNGHPLGTAVYTTLTQQGFTADVNCTTGSGVPSVGFQTTQLGVAAGVPVISSTMTASCTGGTNQTIVASPQNGTLNAVYIAFCEGPDEHSLPTIIISGTGIYDFINTTQCDITSQVTTVDVQYMSDSTSDSEDLKFIDVLEVRGKVLTPEAAAIPLQTLLQSITLGQTQFSHATGDAISALLVSLNGAQGRDLSSDDVNSVVSAYFKGILEFGGTLVRLSYTETNNRLGANGQSDIPSSQQSIVNGTLTSRGVGYRKGNINLFLVLLPPTFLTAGSIILVILTLVRGRQHYHVDDQDYFDPKNILHVMAASSAGGLPHTFPSFMTKKKEFFKHGHSIKVRLGEVRPGHVGFVQSSDSDLGPETPAKFS
ncbi:hypothetical protein BDN72DRAFT_837916 [Pluteus cervinus]|uniref:Uncharacterized protein n=1 Tax=Pluteus cervinus TaxID=181527 RepID=A0ACD3B102_9AGAR|nr:hypothetical protein BDN72DRAFT_837916 [Pluteus cervinus]